MLSLRILCFTELALKLLDGSVDDGSLVSFSFVVIQSTANLPARLRTLMKTSVYIGGGGLGLLEIKSIKRVCVCRMSISLSRRTAGSVF